MTKLEEIISPGVKDILGDPKKALVKLSFPMMLGILVLTFYQLIDAFWVAGLGADALAAVGLFLPFFTVIMAIGTGLGLGVNSSIARNIGKGNKKTAEESAVHAIVLGILISIIIIALTLPFLSELFNNLSGNENVTSMAIDYSRILFISSIFLIFVSSANAILRSEGNVKRAVYGLLLGSGLNIILDPIFIYHLDLGVAGAGWATLVAMMSSSILYLYWLLVKKDIYLNLTLKDFSFDKTILRDILKVGFPSTLSQLSISISLFVLNIIVLDIAGTDGVAVFTSGYRVLLIAMIPVLGIGPSLTTVSGAAFGARDKKKLKTGYFYAIKIGILIEAFVASFIFIFANQIAYIFTYSQNAAHLSEDIANFLRVTAIFYFFSPIDTSTTAMFVGMGKSIRSLAVNILRTIMLQIPICFILGIYLNFGLFGVWAGLVMATCLSAIIAFIWGINTINKSLI